jgi:chloramphenicol 3-O-phosphotransferase
MPAAGALAGRDVRRSPDLWDAYRELVRSVIDILRSVPTVLLGVCTPDELRGWPEAQWILLDCEDDERRRRLAGRSEEEVDGALVDARQYRRLHLPVLDTSARPVDEVARELAALAVPGW